VFSTQLDFLYELVKIHYFVGVRVEVSRELVGQAARLNQGSFEFADEFAGEGEGETKLHIM
jgi:hypothetical protein